MANTKKIDAIIDILKSDYPNPKTELENWHNPVQFMVCVILSAQATDKGVNKVTAKLFSKYKTSFDFAEADIDKLSLMVSSINYYRTKSQRIIDACKFINQNFSGKVPHNIEDLIKIPGIGRKSANVIIQEALGLEAQGVVVDTHVTRVAKRLGISEFSDQKDAIKIEIILKNIVPKNEWKFFSGAIVLHGRYVCKAKKPKCEICKLSKICPSAFLHLGS